MARKSTLRRGKPRTEVQRRARHTRLYGKNSKLPSRRGRNRR